MPRSARRHTMIWRKKLRRIQNSMLAMQSIKTAGVEATGLTEKLLRSEYGTCRLCLLSTRPRGPKQCVTDFPTLGSSHVRSVVWLRLADSYLMTTT